MGNKVFAEIIFNSVLEDLGLLMRENCFLVKNILCHNKLQRKKDRKHFSRYQKQDKNVMGGFQNFFKDDSRQKNVF